MYKVVQKALYYSIDTIAEICMLSNDLHVIEINVDLTIFYCSINESDIYYMFMFMFMWEH